MVIVLDINTFDGSDIWHEAECPEDVLTEDELWDLEMEVTLLLRKTKRLMDTTEEDVEGWLRDQLWKLNTGIKMGVRL